MTNFKLGSTARWAALALCLGSPGGSLAAAEDKGLEAMKHASGWATVKLDLVEKDESGRPTLERLNNAENLITRRSVYFPNGVKAALVFTVIAKGSDQVLYFAKKDWDEDGAVSSIYVKDSTFNAKGQPLNGWIDERHYVRGRLVLSLKKKYSDKTGDWVTLEKQDLIYYSDGDVKERVTGKDPGPKTRETWGAKVGDQPRRKVTRKIKP